MHSESCVFCKIATKEIVVPFVAHNEWAVAFADRAPQAPVHFLIIPRIHIASLNDLSDHHDHVVVGMMQIIRELAQKYGNIEDKGFNLKINTGASAGQVVFHLHWHFLAGN